MYINVAFSANAFQRLIKYRLTEQFIPLVTPINYPAGETSWLDGLIVHDLSFSQLTEANVVLNEVTASGNLQPIPHGYSYPATAVAIDIPMTIFYAKTQDVANAGLADPPVGEIPILKGVVRIIMRSLIAADGLPHLQMQLDTARLASLPLPPEAIASLNNAATLDAEFDIGAALGDLLPQNNRRVLNTAITLDPQGNILMRFEFPSLADSGVVARWQEWQNFVQNTPAAKLGNQDWCVDVEGSLVAANMAQTLNPLIENQHPVYFSPGIDYSFQNGRPPGVTITKAGHIENACAGNNIRFDAIVHADISVPPQGNAIRAALSFDINKNDWDVAKCFGIILINPLSIFITLFDNKMAGIGFAAQGLDLVVPTRPLIVFGGLILLIIGFDKKMAKKLVDEQLAEEPMVQKQPDGSYAFEQVVTLNNPVTLNWMLLREAVGEDGRLLIRGALQVPDPILPKLKAKDLEGFTPWHLLNRCEPGRGQTSTASLQLFLHGGYGANPALAAQTKPTIRLRYGARTYEVVNDPLGVYQDLQTEYTQIYFPGIPGQLEATLRSTTLQKQRFEAFGTQPYPLRIRIFTNGGVREYEFAAPGIYKPYEESLAQAAERINKCKLLMNDKYFSIKWLVDPPPYEKVGQHWQFHTRGLEQGKKARVFNQDTGKMLGEFRVNEYGRLDISLKLPPEQHSGSLLIAMDDAPYLNANEMKALRERAGKEDVQHAEIAVRQSNLFKMEQVAFDEAVKQLSFENQDHHLTVKATTSKGKNQIRLLSNNGLFLKHKASAYQEMNSLALESEGKTKSNESHKGNKKHDAFLIVSGLPEDLLLLADEEAKAFTLYREGPAVMVGATLWEE